MRVSRPLNKSEPAKKSFAAADDAPDGGQSAMRLLAAAAYISGPRLAGGARLRPAASSGGWTDPARPAAASALQGPTVSGAGAGSAGDHVGSAMLLPPPSTVALSDGTRISFRAVAESPEMEDA